MADPSSIDPTQTGPEKGISELEQGANRQVPRTNVDVRPSLADIATQPTGVNPIAEAGFNARSAAATSAGAPPESSAENSSSAVAGDSPAPDFISGPLPPPD